MRIRSLKPEFWPHPVMARQPDSVRLAAIALLNIADDDGVFVAEPAIVRSAIWPFDEDSTNARRVLDTLSEIGWVEVRKHPTHGLVGRVINFKKHQRIDRPSPSKLATYFFDEHSTIIRRVLDESSSPDQGSGIRDQGSGSKEQGAGKYIASAAAERDLVEVESTEPPKPKSAEPKPRQRNPLFDTLAELEGGADNLTRPAAKRVGVALSVIAKATPNLTPDEIRRRIANLRLHMPHALATATSLASHWARCASGPDRPGGHDTAPENPRNVYIGTPETRAAWERDNAEGRAASERRELAGEIPFT